MTKQLLDADKVIKLINDYFVSEQERLSEKDPSLCAVYAGTLNHLHSLVCNAIESGELNAELGGFTQHLLDHESDIALDINDFGRLANIFTELFGRPPESP